MICNLLMWVPPSKIIRGGGGWGGDGALHHLPLLFAKVCINAIAVLGNAKESKLTSNDCDHSHNRVIQFENKYHQQKIDHVLGLCSSSRVDCYVY